MTSPTATSSESDPDVEPTRLIAGDSRDDLVPARGRVQVGRRLDRYLVLEEIGAGGMGEVVLAYDPELDRRVAIKLIRSRRQDDDDGEEIQARLVREAQALAKLSHPNVVAVHDVGTVEGEVYVAMEFVQGQTLAAWLKSTPRPWAEIVARVRAAGAGLAAAHRQGIVHRDFKPGNVMVGDDGRVRVLDFGLARQVGGVGPGSGDSERSFSSDELEISQSGRSTFTLDRPLTETGVLMGTPAYMAPEQFRGQSVDARTDQFALCVVLFEALYGKRPFAGRSMRELQRAVVRGRIEAVDRPAGVPRRLESIIRKGLAVEPADRFATTDDLLAEIDRAVRPKVKLQWLALGGLALVGAGIGLAGGGDEGPCRGASERVAEIWSSDTHATVRDAFARTGVSYAATTWEHVAPILDEYAASWAQAHTEACEATRIRGEQSEARLDRRMRCLGRRLDEFAAVASVLASATPKTVENAVTAASTLAPVERCADDAFLDALVIPPDPQIAQRVAAAEARLAELRAASVAGDYDREVEIADGLFEDARALGYPSLIAETAFHYGIALDRHGDRKSLDVFVEGLRNAAAGDNGYYEAMILGALVGHFGYYAADPTRPKYYAEHARGVLARLGEPPVAAGNLAIHEANALLRAGDFDAAIERFHHVLEIEGEERARLMQRMAAISNLAALAGMRGNFEKAAEEGARAVELMTAEMGPEHPMTGVGLNNLGATQMRLGDLEAAERNLTRAEAVLTAAFPDGHPELAKALHNHGQLLQDRGDWERARELYERALRIKRQHLGAEHTSTAHTLNNLGDLLRLEGKTTEARGYLEQAVKAWETALGPDHPETAVGLVSLGQLDLAEGRTTSAIEHLERALVIREKAEAAHLELGEVRFSLARALDERSAADRPRALELARAALEDVRAEASAKPEQITRIEQWLAERHELPASP